MHALNGLYIELYKKSINKYNFYVIPVVKLYIISVFIIYKLCG